MQTHPRVKDYLRCLAIKRDKFTPEQAAYLEQLNAFVATKPTAEQFIQWQREHPFPATTPMTPPSPTSGQHVSPPTSKSDDGPPQDKKLGISKESTEALLRNVPAGARTTVIIKNPVGSAEKEELLWQLNSKLRVRSDLRILVLPAPFITEPIEQKLQGTDDPLRQAMRLVGVTHVVIYDKGTGQASAIELERGEVVGSGRFQVEEP